MSRPGRAVVIGGSVAGLAAARALSGRVDEVVVVERDVPSGTSPRRGTPQAHQVHTLLAGGQEAAEVLFPGITAELIAAGAVPVDFGADVAFRHFGRWKPRFATGLRGTLQSRGLLEAALRRRVEGLPGVRLLHGVRVEGLRLDGAGRRIAGVRIGPPGVHESGILQADVVVDASGRGSRLRHWLAGGGFPPVSEERVHLGVAYAGRIYRRDPLEAEVPRARIVYPKAPGEHRSGVLLAVERDRWLVGLAGYRGRGPEADPARLHHFAAGLGDPALLRILTGAEPLGPVRRYSVPYQFRRRYERAGFLPLGMAVVGDAACSLDPLFGQGMSVALRAARRFDAVGGGGGPERMARRLQREVARSVRVPWLLTSSEAGRYGGVAAGLPAPLLRRYAARVFELSAADPHVFMAFLRLMHLTRPLSSVFSPWMVWRVARSALPLSRSPAPRPAVSFGGAGSD